METQVEKSNEGFDSTSKRGERPGFVTFWLWLIIIGNVIAAIIDLFPKTMWGSRYPDDYVIPSIILGVLSIISVVGACLLLNQKKAGFTLIALSAIVGGLIGIIAMGSIPYSIVGLVILWLILKIKKNDVPYWDTLD